MSFAEANQLSLSTYLKKTGSSQLVESNRGTSHPWFWLSNAFLSHFSGQDIFLFSEPVQSQRVVK